MPAQHRELGRLRRGRRQLGDTQRVLELGPALGPQLGDLTGQRAHPAERLRAFRSTDCASGVEHVEGVGAAQYVDMRGDRQPGVEHPAGLGRVLLEEPLLALHIRVVEVVPAHLVLRLAEDLAVRDARRVSDLLEVRHALQRHHDPLDAVGDLHRHRVERHPAGLLEVGELGDLQTVQPDLPAQTPGTRRRVGPVVLDEADVVRVDVDPEHLEAGQEELLRVARVRLQHHLELGVRLQPVRVLAVAAVVRPDTRLDVRDTPRLGTEHPQDRRRVQRAGSHLGVERLHDHAAPVGPVLRQREQRVLHGEHDNNLRFGRISGIEGRSLLALR